MNEKFPEYKGLDLSEVNKEIIKNLGRKQDFRNEFEDTGRSPFIRFL